MPSFAREKIERLIELVGNGWSGCALRARAHSPKVLGHVYQLVAGGLEESDRRVRDVAIQMQIPVANK